MIIENNGEDPSPYLVRTSNAVLTRVRVCQIVARGSEMEMALRLASEFRFVFTVTSETGHDHTSDHFRRLRTFAMDDAHRARANVVFLQF